MFFIWKRYTRSGYAPPLFYALLGSGFVALAILALVRGEWLLAALAALMVAVTVFGSRMMKRFADAAGASRRALAEHRENEGHE